MQENMRVNSQQLHTQDPAARVRPAKDPPVLNQVDPTRVTGSNTAQNPQATKDDGLGMLLNQNSVYNRFVNQLSTTPGLAQTLKKVMFEAFSMEGKPIKAGQLNSVLAELSAKLKLSPDQIIEALQYQNENQTKFSGGLFDSMRELLAANKTNKEFENLLGRFLKSYNGYLSTESTLKAIVSNLKQIGTSMPVSYSKQLDSLIAKLSLDASVGIPADAAASAAQSEALDNNLLILKREIIPFLSNYIGTTNDFGRSRDIITLLINNIARLNTSSRDDVIAKFVDLIDFCKFTFDMDDHTIDQLKLNFANRLSDQTKPANDMFDSIAKLLSEGSSKEQSYTSRAMYKDIATSLLLDNSVFMPLNHLFLPINYQGKFMFSEIWIEKDGKQQSQTVDQKPITKMMINFDIKGTGFFEAVLWISEDNVDVELNYPSTIATKTGDIRDNVASILRKNGLNVNNLVLSMDEPPRRVQDVFKNLFDARRGIDVTI